MALVSEQDTAPAAVYFNLQPSTATQLRRVAGQHAIRIELAAGDRVSIQSPDGHQGQPALTLLARQAATSATASRQQLAENSAASRHLQVCFGQLDGQQKRLAGEIVSLPLYDPERSRVRS